MKNVLVLTTDLPFFPGKNGNDFFNLRYLAQRHSVGVVAPLHPHYPSEGVANLESFLTRSYLWPRPLTAIPPLPPQKNSPGRLAGWLRLLPFGIRKDLLLRLVRLRQQPPDAYGQLGTFANCAPYVLQAIGERHWQLIGLIQSSTEPWLDYLPAQPAKFVYFHDVRADYLSRQARVSNNGNVPERRKLRAVFAQEHRYCHRVETVGFVSDLDRQRAVKLFRPSAEVGVAPIPVDTDYYTPAPNGSGKDGRAIVLFTGHLGHPPNVDAVQFFIEHIWPSVLKEQPSAVFQVVGRHPDARLKEICSRSPHVELCANVPDIRPYFWNAGVYVVPMRFGGGVRQKIFEAWSMEVPVVCTTMAAEGIQVRSGENCWIEDDPAGFASRIVNELRAPTTSLPSQAKQTVLAHNSIPAAASCFEQLAERSVHIKKKRPYKLLFDLRWMKIGKAGGQEQMSYELIAAIARLDHRNEYRLLCPRSTYYEWEFPKGFRCRGHFTDSNEAKLDAYRAGLANLLAKSLRRQPVLTPEMRALRWYNRLDFDLVQSVCSYSYPDLRMFPTILTVHDLQHFHYPEFFSRDAWRERESLYRDSAARAAHIICISEFTRMNLHKSYGVPLEKMTTIWNIPSRAAWLRMDAEKRRELLARLGLHGRFLFYPAHCWPHKNHRRLLEAFEFALPELPKDIQLVLSGNNFGENHPARELMQSGNLNGRVLHLGYRSPLEMRALYCGAHALVFPSLFEGFGMPVAEAIIADRPVACSDATSLPEIAGDAAIYFDPLDTKRIAHALIRVSTDDKLRADLLAAGLRRKLHFSARLSAVKTLSVYRRVYEEVYSGWPIPAES